MMIVRITGCGTNGLKGRDMDSRSADAPLELFHLLVGEDGEPICVGFGPKRSDCKTVAMISGTYKYYTLPDRERGLLMRKLVEAANSFLQAEQREAAPHE